MVERQVKINRFDVFLIKPDPTYGSEIQKTWPCVIISPDEMNNYISTIIVAPMTTKGRPYPTRVPITFDSKEGQIILDQICTVDKGRLIKKLGSLEKLTQQKILCVLQEMFLE